MKLYSEMTNDELDRHIAELKGWVIYKEIRGEYTLQTAYSPEKYEPWKNYKDSEEEKKRYTKIEWSDFDEKEGFAYGGVPCYSTDPRYAMELLKEMPFQTTLHNYENKLDGTKMHWGCTVANLVKPSETIQALADTPERAIAEAYAELRAG